MSMRKVFTTFFAVVLVVSTFTGCGKSAEQKEMDEFQKELEESGIDVDDISDTIDALNAADEEMTREKEETAEYTSTFKKYPKDPGWNETKTNEQPIQIDDVLFKMGERLGDVMERFADSDVDYEYDYSPDMLMTDGAYEEIYFERNGVLWFTIEVENIFGETKSLQDLPVWGYNVEENKFRKITYGEPGLTPIPCLIGENGALFFSVEDWAQRNEKNVEDFYTSVPQFLCREGYDQLICMGYEDDIMGDYIVAHKIGEDQELLIREDAIITYFDVSSGGKWMSVSAKPVLSGTARIDESLFSYYYDDHTLHAWLILDENGLVKEIVEVFES